jgi:hypothetical protein
MMAAKRVYTLATAAQHVLHLTQLPLPLLLLLLHASSTSGP